MKKRFFSMLLVLAMCLSLLPMTVLGASNDVLVSKGAQIIQDFTINNESGVWGAACCFDGNHFSRTNCPEHQGAAVFKLQAKSKITRIDLYLSHEKFPTLPRIRDYSFKVLDMPTEKFEDLSRDEKTNILHAPWHWKTLCTVTGNTQDFRSHKIDLGDMDGGQIFMLDVTDSGSGNSNKLNIFEIELYGTPDSLEDPNEHRMPGYQIDWSENFDVKWNGPLPEGWYYEDKLGVGEKCYFFVDQDVENTWLWIHHGKNALRFVTAEVYANTWLYSPSFRVREGNKMTFALRGGALMANDRGYSDYRDNTEYLKVYVIENGKEPVQLGKTCVTQAYWKNFEMDLSDYAGKDIQLAFVHSGETSAKSGCLSEAGILLDCLKIWKPQATSANVIFKVLNGTWDGSDAKDKVVTVPLTNGMGTLPRNKVPTGMVPNEGYGKGSWLVEPNTSENCVTGDTVYIYSFAPKAEENPFTDVKESDWFYDPVLWAVDNGITQGIGEGLFGPARSCTRAEVVTFLWRAAKMPEPSSLENPFPDVKESDWFFKPVLWAVESGITVGADGGNFRPGRICNRGEIVTFLWRSEGQPSPESLSNTFPDVKQTDWFYNPVLWAVEHGITVGADGGNFRPERECTRAEVVTFLYRAESK